MFFSGWGSPSSIQSASMDGTSKGTLHSTGLTHPNDIALDLPMQRVYWTDGFMGTIEYSYYNGSSRTTLVQIDSYIFGITLDTFLVFFSEWSNNTIRYVHKLDETSPILTINDNLRAYARGMVLVHPNRQPSGTYKSVASHTRARKVATVEPACLVCQVQTSKMSMISIRLV